MPKQRYLYVKRKPRAQIVGPLSFSTPLSSPALRELPLIPPLTSLRVHGPSPNLSPCGCNPNPFALIAPLRKRLRLPIDFLDQWGSTGRESGDRLLKNLLSLWRKSHGRARRVERVAEILGV